MPLLRPASVVVISLAVINTLKGFDIVFMLTKGGPFHTSDNLAMFMYSETFFKYQVGYGAAIATALFVAGHHRHRHLLPAGAGLGAPLWLASRQRHRRPAAARCL